MCLRRQGRSVKSENAHVKKTFLSESELTSCKMQYLQNSQFKFHGVSPTPLPQNFKDNPRSTLKILIHFCANVERGAIWLLMITWRHCLSFVRKVRLKKIRGGVATSPLDWTRVKRYRTPRGGRKRLIQFGNQIHKQKLI